MIQNIAEECSTFQSKALICPFVYVCNQGICIPRSSIGKAYALTKMNRTFLVEIPSLVDGSVEYNVTIEPKAEWVKPVKPTPSKPHKPHVKTGDDTNISVWVIAAIESLCIMILLYKNKADSL